jgi:Ser/Thr protein kinase RdoA (MazF antagonist)
MHALTPRYRPSDPATRRPAWDEDDLLWNADRYLPAGDAVGRRRLEGCLAALRGLPRTPDSYGLVHRDLHHGNFRAAEHRITVFDFDDCAYFWFAGDLAMPLYYAVSDISREEPERRAGKIREMLPPLLEGYREENQLDRDWLRQLPMFWKLRDLELYLFCHKTFDRERLTEGQERFLGTLTAAVRTGDPALAMDLDRL